AAGRRRLPAGLLRDGRHRRLVAPARRAVDPGARPRPPSRPLHLRLGRQALGRYPLVLRGAPGPGLRRRGSRRPRPGGGAGRRRRLPGWAGHAAAAVARGRRRALLAAGAGPVRVPPRPPAGSLLAVVSGLLPGRAVPGREPPGPDVAAA